MLQTAQSVPNPEFVLHTSFRQSNFFTVNFPTFCLYTSTSHLIFISNSPNPFLTVCSVF